MTETSGTTLTTEWTSAGPLNQKVETTLGETNPNETPEEHTARHVAAVNSLKAAFPPIPDGQ